MGEETPPSLTPKLINWSRPVATEKVFYCICCTKPILIGQQYLRLVWKKHPKKTMDTNQLCFSCWQEIGGDAYEVFEGLKERGAIA